MYCNNDMAVMGSGADQEPGLMQSRVDLFGSAHAFSPMRQHIEHGDVIITILPRLLPCSVSLFDSTSRSERSFHPGRRSIRPIHYTDGEVLAVLQQESA